MACSEAGGLKKCVPDPTDPQAVRTAMETINRLVDVVYQILNDGRPVMDAAGDGTILRDAADGKIVRQARPTNGMYWPHTHGPQAVNFALDGVAWSWGDGGAFTAQTGIDGFGHTEMAAGHYHPIYFTVREAWDGRSRSLRPEGV